MIRLAFALVVLCSVVLVHALEPTVQSVKIKADKMTAPTKPDARQRQVFTFLGNVRMSSGTLTLHSEKFTVFKQYDKVITLRAMGDARLYDLVQADVAEKLGIPVGSELNAQADDIYYSVVKKTVVFTGNAIMQWQGNLIKGDEIEFDLEKYQVISSTAENGAPTEIILESIGPKKLQATRPSAVSTKPKPTKLPENTPTNKPVPKPVIKQ